MQIIVKSVIYSQTEVIILDITKTQQSQQFLISNLTFHYIF